MMMLTNSESKVISWIRVVSMIFIVTCHICQTYGNNWAYVFNIGVQTFLVLSGFLYGNKVITVWGNWIFGRINRVYFPMLTLLLLLLPAYLILRPTFFSWKLFITNIVNIQGVLFVIGGV